MSTTRGYVDQLYRLAYARVLNRQDAEDIVQETYLKAYRSYETTGGESGRLKNWMTRILMNTGSDRFRKEARSVPIADGLELEVEVQANSTASPEDQPCNQVIDPRLLGALKLIPDTYLVPLLLREIHDASYDEIASLLDVPKGTVMSRLSRRRALLRKGFFAEGDGHQLIEDNSPKNGSRGSSR